MPKWVTGTIYMMVVIHSLCTSQIYAMIVFDNLERMYVSRQHKVGSSLAAFVGGMTLPLVFWFALAFMWIAIKKPPQAASCVVLTIFLGCLGTLISVVQVAGALWNLVVYGLEANFFRP
ncbi:hypothetical protein HAX54_032353 [Datura stramonium]|uniref:Uncharacterized protein n=1 Tax=Datura stramonium TaxID=4076 RepID=A0ABS8VE26_DATST|nr:hypothetical protein [Datura stramonium]